MLSPPRSNSSVSFVLIVFSLIFSTVIALTFYSCHSFTLLRPLCYCVSMFLRGFQCFSLFSNLYLIIIFYYVFSYFLFSQFPSHESPTSLSIYRFQSSSAFYSTFTSLSLPSFFLYLLRFIYLLCLLFTLSPFYSLSTPSPSLPGLSSSHCYLYCIYSFTQSSHSSSLCFLVYFSSEASSPPPHLLPSLPSNSFVTVYLNPF